MMCECSHSRTLVQNASVEHNKGETMFLWSAAPASPGHIRLQPVCGHPGALHLVDRALARRIATSTVTEAEVEWLTLVGEAIKLCGEWVPPVEWGTNRGATPHIMSHIASDLSTIDLSQPLPGLLQPVWRPTSTKPLWVCEEHAALYRTRGSGVAQATASEGAWDDYDIMLDE